MEEATGVYRKINADLWHGFEQGKIGIQELKIKRFRSLLAHFNSDSNPEEMAVRYLDSLSGKDCLLPHARETLSSLCYRAPLGLVTNGISRVQRRRIEKAGIRERFSAIFISEEQGISKPDARVFARAAAALGLPLSRLLFVGDNPATDILAAMHAGMDACWFVPSDAPWPHPAEAPNLSIRELSELLRFAPGLFP